MAEIIPETPEATPPSGDGRHITFTDVVEFMEAAGVSGPCPYCGNPKWELLVGDNENDVRKTPTIPTVVQGKEQSGISASTHFPVILAICNRCAYTRLHSRKKISNWVRDGKPELPRDE